MHFCKFHGTDWVKIFFLRSISSELYSYIRGVFVMVSGIITENDISRFSEGARIGASPAYVTDFLASQQ